MPALEAADAGEVPERRPERFGPIERELIEGAVVPKADPPLMFQGVPERGDVGGRDALARGRPERRRHSPGLYDPAAAGPGV
jgi:hypothetical protein